MTQWNSSVKGSDSSQDEEETSDSDSFSMSKVETSSHTSSASTTQSIDKFQTLKYDEKKGRPNNLNFSRTSRNRNTNSNMQDKNTGRFRSKISRESMVTKNPGTPKDNLLKAYLMEQFENTSNLLNAIGQAGTITRSCRKSTDIYQMESNTGCFF